MIFFFFFGIYLNNFEFSSLSSGFMSSITKLVKLPVILVVILPVYLTQNKKIIFVLTSLTSRQTKLENPELSTK